MIADRELSWITKGTPLAVVIDGHRYRGEAVEQVEPDGVWEVALEHHGGVYELGRDDYRTPPRPAVRVRGDTVRPDRCLIVRGATPENIDRLVEAGRLEPGDAVEVKRFLAYLRTVAALSAAGASRAAAKAAAYAEHYPEDQPSDDVEKVGGETRQGDGGNPE